MIFGLFFGFILLIIILISASTKKGTSKMSKPSRIRSFTTKTPSDKVMKTVIKFAQSNGYKVDDFNERDSIIVLSDSASLTSYGNIYPVYLIKQPDNLLLVQVGIKSKATQVVGLNAPLERCFNGIKTAIYAAS